MAASDWPVWDGERERVIECPCETERVPGGCRMRTNRWHSTLFDRRGWPRLLWSKWAGSLASTGQARFGHIIFLPLLSQSGTEGDVLIWVSEYAWIWICLCLHQDRRSECVKALHEIFFSCSDNAYALVFCLKFWPKSYMPHKKKEREMINHVKEGFSSCWQFWCITCTGYAYFHEKITLPSTTHSGYCLCSVLLCCLSTMYIIMGYWQLFCHRAREKMVLFITAYNCEYLSWAALAAATVIQMFLLYVSFHAYQLHVGGGWPHSTQWERRDGNKWRTTT